MKLRDRAKLFGYSAIAVFVLAVAPSANAQSCSTATIKGVFARTDNGWVIQNGVAIPLTGISVMTFDGNGKWTAVGSGKLNGAVSESTGSGTYTVNPDCTGSYEPDVAPPGRTGKANLVVVLEGKEIHILPMDPGSSILCNAKKVADR
ncbi:MAG: hypothetical protein JST93_13150 [Acidobacteria bacterium]|nr:hypothetical protein [Acidobacteriota bacterium]